MAIAVHTCPKCGSRDVDVYRFPLPSELPLAVALFLDNNTRDNLSRLLSTYAFMEISICKNCGYSEIVFIKRSSISTQQER